MGLFLACAGCARESSALPLDIATLEQLSPENTAGITYEEEGGTFVVSIIDKYGDGHRHRLILGDSTRAQALELLRQKQIELERSR
jgi:hypothetical protein